MHKQMPNFKPHCWVACSEWTWDSTRQARVRVCQNSQGYLEYEWVQRDLSPAGHGQTPRAAAMDGTTERLSSLSSIATKAQDSGCRSLEKKEPKLEQTTSQAKEEEKLQSRESSSGGRFSTASRGHGGSTIKELPLRQLEGTQVPVGHLNATAESDEQGELDYRYRLEHSTRFQPGEIFKVHWSEPQGLVGDSSGTSSKANDAQNKFGTRFFVGFRRFIIVANDHGHCTCVPILTYGGKGCRKNGVKPEKHGIVYERGRRAKTLDREPSLGFSPVSVEITQEGERISRESRVNYSKLFTVEHNVKVFFIGHVSPDDWQTVRDAVGHCWDEKTHQKQQRR